MSSQTMPSLKAIFSYLRYLSPARRVAINILLLPSCTIYFSTVLLYAVLAYRNPPTYMRSALAFYYAFGYGARLFAPIIPVIQYYTWRVARVEHEVHKAAGRGSENQTNWPKKISSLDFGIFGKSYTGWGFAVLLWGWLIALVLGGEWEWFAIMATLVFIKIFEDDKKEMYEMKEKIGDKEVQAKTGDEEVRMNARDNGIHGKTEDKVIFIKAGDDGVHMKIGDGVVHIKAGDGGFHIKAGNDGSPLATEDSVQTYLAPKA